ncbi:MAG: glycosyltransferase [Thaumarchaeota archaeon]|nr:glycosyltransferase [Nitrososphaerota archaeon]
MNIAIIGNIASQGYVMGKELRSRGHLVDNYCANNVFLSNPEMSHFIDIGKKYHIPFERTIRRFVYRHKKKYDLEVRFYSPKYVNTRHSVMIYVGSDIRDGIIPPENHCFAVTKDLFQYLKEYDARFLPWVIDTDLFKPAGNKPKTEKIRVGHFPTDPKMKGSHLVTEAISILRKKGYQIEYVSDRVPHDKMPEYLSSLDMLCDSFKLGIYGQIAIESLAVGTPVVCYVEDRYFLHEEMKNQIVNCSPDAESIALAILKAKDKKVDPDLVRHLHSPKTVVDILLSTLSEWGFM